MSNVYIKSGKEYTAVDSDELTAYSTLPSGVYSLMHTYHGYKLKTVDNFTIPNKIYGNVVKLASRILKTYNDRPNSTGVLLTGIKGSGKTLLAKYISYLGCKDNLITIIISENFNGEEFNTFIQSIDQSAIILFDEFEKVYDDYDQSQMLTLFDGVYNQKKLFIVTCNDCGKIDTNMHNRPGRMYYSIHFKGIDSDFARDYCNENLINKEYIDDVVKCIESAHDFSFDMLQVIVEEMNRYNENVIDVVKLLNITVDINED